MTWSHPSASLSGSLHPKGEAYNAKVFLRLFDDRSSLCKIDEEYGLFKKFFSIYGSFRASDIQRMARPLVGVVQRW